MTRRGWLAAVCALSLAWLAAGALPATRPAAASPHAAQPRPALSGAESTYGTAHFLVHYTLTGVDAIPAADADADGTPDWAAEVGAVMETVWRAQVEVLGWPAPLPDRGEGGDARFDVYLMELFSRNLGGYVSPDGGFVGDNPNTPRQEQQAAFGYMVLENDFVDPNPPPRLRVWPPEDWLRIIAAHEFNHALQIAINGMHSMHWWAESTANWAETQVFPDLRDNLVAAEAVFKSPDTCLLRYGGVNRVESGLHWYGLWVFNQVLSEQYGPDLILDIWQRMGDSPGYAPFDDAFAARDTTFEAEMRRLALALLLRGFADGAAYPTVRLQEAVDGPGEWSPADGVQRYAMDYIGLDLAAPYTIELSGQDAGLQAIVVGVRGTVADVFPAGRAVTVDFGAYEHAYLIVLNLTRPPNEAGCATARYTYAVREPGEAQPADPAERLTAPYFTPPRVEPVTDPEDLPLLDPFYRTEYSISHEIRQVALPFEPVVPRGAPPGYELDSVYGLNADEQGTDFIALHAPSGGVVAQMLYYDRAGRLIRITESPTIYVTIGEWLAANRLESAPGVQVWTAGGIDTAIVDRAASGGGSYLVAFVVREKFVALDGDAALEDMLDMAARFATSFR